MKSDMKMSPDWKAILKEELQAPYFRKMLQFLEAEKKQGKIIYPQDKEVFNAFLLTPFSKVKVVLLGQDPYHGENQAHGLSFSVVGKGKLPPSLRNIFKELKSDLQCEPMAEGNLSYWAQQGVLLLNTILTVEKGKANAHRKIGWQKFTDAVIQKISNQKEDIIFVLWGKEAAKKEELVDPTKHLILKSAHPSPLSAYNGFWNSRPFSKINQYLSALGKEEINWGIQPKENGKIKN